MLNINPFDFIWLLIDSMITISSLWHFYKYIYLWLMFDTHTNYTMFYDDKWYIDKMDKTITAKWQIEIVLSERNATSPGMLMLAAYHNWTLPLHLRLDTLFFRKSFDSTISFLHEQKFISKSVSVAT